MNQYPLIKFKVVVFLTAAILCIIGIVSAQTLNPSAASASPTNYGSKKLVPDDDRSGSTSSVPDDADQPSQDQLISLLKEQNKRLKAAVEHLQRENAQLKAKLAERQ